MNRYNAQILNDKGEYHLQFETDSRDNFNAMENLAQKFMDNKPQPPKDEPIKYCNSAYHSKGFRYVPILDLPISHI